MMEKGVFRLVLMKEASDFIHALPKKAQNKISCNIRRVMLGERNADLFKKIEGTDIWEFRTQYFGTAYRMFAFWDKDGETLVVATHGIIKKKQKTPMWEIEKATRIRKEYFNAKIEQK